MLIMIPIWSLVNKYDATTTHITTNMIALFFKGVVATPATSPPPPSGSATVDATGLRSVALAGCITLQGGK